MNWNKWIRQIHGGFSVVLAAAMIVNVVAIAMRKYSDSIGLVAVAPFAFLFLTGLYLFALPYISRWRSSRSAF